MVHVGVFDSHPLYVKEPNGEIKPENEWNVKGSMRLEMRYNGLTH